MLSKWHYFIPSYGWAIFHCIYIAHLTYPFICQWTFRLLPCLGYGKLCCYEYWDVCIFLNCFLCKYAQKWDLQDYMITLVFLKNLQTLHHSGCINLHPHQQWYLFLHTLSRVCYLQTFLMMVILTGVRWYLICSFDLYFSSN